MPVRRFRSIEEARKALRLKPGSGEHFLAVRSVFGIASVLSPPSRLPPGVYRFRSIEEAQNQRTAWRKGPASRQ